MIVEISKYFEVEQYNQYATNIRNVNNVLQIMNNLSDMNFSFLFDRDSENEYKLPEIARDPSWRDILRLK